MNSDDITSQEIVEIPLLFQMRNVLLGLMWKILCSSDILVMEPFCVHTLDAHT